MRARVLQHETQAGRTDLTQYWTRWILQNKYSELPSGLAGKRHAHAAAVPDSLSPATHPGVRYYCTSQATTTTDA